MMPHMEWWSRWDLVTDRVEPLRHAIWYFPCAICLPATSCVGHWPDMPLAGHRGDCEKVQAAQFKGALTGNCTCGAES